MKTFLLPILLFPILLNALPTAGSKIMITASSPEAVEVGKKIYKLGGNVADVAVATWFTMAVTRPYFAALGGGGFALTRFNNKIEALDFREVAPESYTETTFKDLDSSKSKYGGLAIGVPGMLAGFYEIHNKYGKLKWYKVIQPAIDLANKGFYISKGWADQTARASKKFNTDGKGFFLNKGKNYKPGDLLVQKQLAQALRLIQLKGPKAFYEGKITKDLVDTINQNGGNISLEDFKTYKIKWRTPMTADFHDHKVYMMPPPSSGGPVLITAFHLMEHYKLNTRTAFSVNELHLLTEIMSRSFRGRVLLGDPDFHENPFEKILSKDYFNRLTNTVSYAKTIELKPLKEQGPQKPESTETTHFNVVDSKGNAISSTITLNASYGSGIVSKKYGIALNNEIDDFTTKLDEPNMYGLIQGYGNRIQAGKRPLSSMTPTLVEKDNKLVLALGAPGGPKIISSILQVLYRHLVNNYDIDEAIQAPRLHHQFLPHKVFYYKNKLVPETIKGLKAKGHDMVEHSWSGKVYGISIKDDILFGAHDSRADGASGGY